MDILIITGGSNNVVVAVVEKPTSMSAEGTALAWAKANGYLQFPKDCQFSEGKMTTFGSVMLSLMPCHEVESLNAGDPSEVPPR